MTGDLASVWIAQVLFDAAVCYCVVRQTLLLRELASRVEARDATATETREALVEIVENAKLAPPGERFARDVLLSRGAWICRQPAPGEP